MNHIFTFVRYHDPNYTNYENAYCTFIGSWLGINSIFA